LNRALLHELELVSKEVNSTLNSMFGIEQEPQIFYKASKHLIDAGGKRLRPFLTLKACEIVGGKSDEVLQIAASIEFIHTFTLVHDDIMDSDYIRRGVPTVHVLWGIPLAIIAGDLLFAKAYETILRTKQSSSSQLLKVLSTVNNATLNICEGQALDLLFEKRRDVTEKEYLEMIYKKTAVLLEAAAKVGALIGGGTSDQIKKIGDFAHYSGLAFQIIDDVLGLKSCEETLGKPFGSDIREGKNTIVLIHALAKADIKVREQILSIMGNRKAKSDQISKVIQMIDLLGSFDYAIKKAEILIEKAKKELVLFPPSQSKDMLIDLCNYILSRKY